MKKKSKTDIHTYAKIKYLYLLELEKDEDFFYLNKNMKFVKLFELIYDK